jgi:hypothetical protein
MAGLAQFRRIITGVVHSDTKAINAGGLEHAQHVGGTFVGARRRREIRWQCARIGGKFVGDGFERGALCQPQRLEAPISRRGEIADTAGSPSLTVSGASEEIPAG